MVLISLLFIGCQNMDRPELGYYPNDANVLGFRIGGAGNPAEGWMNSWTGDLDQFIPITFVK